jgi:hypothetical protein
MHKARWSVDFVAQSDLDEIFHMVSGNSLIEHLNWLKRKYPAMASANFMSRRVKVPVGDIEIFPFVNSRPIGIASHRLKNSTSLLYLRPNLKREFLNGHFI